MQELVLAQHRVLKVAEPRQEVLHEMIERLLGLRRRHPEPERAQIAEMVAEPVRDEIEHLRGDRVRLDMQRRRAQQVRLCRLAVVVVEVPLATRGFVALHQEPGLAAHLAVEILHPQFLAALGPGVELVERTDEPVIRQRPHRQWRRVQRLDQAPFAGLRREHLGGVVLLPAAHQFADDGSGRVGVVEAGIGHLPALAAQLFGEMPHRRQDQRDLLGVMRDIAPLVHHLGHDHHIAGLVRRLQRRETGTQLIAEHEDQPAHHGTLCLASRRTARSRPASARRSRRAGSVPPLRARPTGDGRDISR